MNKIIELNQSEIIAIHGSCACHSYVPKKPGIIATITSFIHSLTNRFHRTKSNHRVVYPNPGMPKPRIVVCYLRPTTVK